MAQKFSFLCTAYLFLIADNKILLQRRFQTGFEDGNYSVPAGHINGNETIREGCAREMQEEIGITIDPEDLEVVHVMQRKCTDAERISFFLTTTKYQGNVTNCEPHKCDDLRWFALDELPDNTVDYVRRAIEYHHNHRCYSERGYEK